jgi:CheY-like chemotaxis protein
MSDEKLHADEKDPHTSVAVACIQAFPRVLLLFLVAAFLYANKADIRSFLARATGLSFGGVSIAANYGTLSTKFSDGDKALQAVGNRTAILWARASLPCYSGAQILWVDDHPEYNAPYRRVIEGWGAKVMAAQSNADAERLLDARTFDVVISDIARDDPKDQSGLALIKELQKRWPNDAPPIIFFIAQVTGPKPEGSFALTNRSDELIFNLTDALASRPGRC